MELTFNRPEWHKSLPSAIKNGNFIVSRQQKLFLVVKRSQSNYFQSFSSSSNSQIANQFAHHYRWG